MFPYGGYEEGSPRDLTFWKLIEKAITLSIHKPLIILNQDTKRRKFKGSNIRLSQAFEKHPRREDFVDTLEVWSVDTCQMWLAGWGKVISDNEIIEKEGKSQIRRIIQLPGDIKEIPNQESFYQKLEKFCKFDFSIADGRFWDLVIGDFKAKKFSGKNLIDVYGTLPLLSNWFPEISERIFDLPLYKPRSEFLNMRVGFLKEILVNHRKFAYEQTLNMLIYAWKNNDYNYKIRSYNLGKIEDDSGFRKYQGCLDQIERTERMLKLLWREKYKLPDSPTDQDFKNFINDYDMLVNRSQAICETARFTIRSLLGLRV